MPGFMRRAMVYLGLVDDEFDEYEVYDEPQPSQPPRTRVAAGGEVATEPTSGTIRTLPRENPAPMEPPSGVTLQSRPAVVRPITQPQGKPHVVEPTDFKDAQQIGDRLKNNQQVIVTLEGVPPDLSRRLIDFCSGATYVLGGSMDKVTQRVFLLSPANSPELSAEEKRRWQERGLPRT